MTLKNTRYSLFVSKALEKGRESKQLMVHMLVYLPKCLTKSLVDWDP